MDNYWLVSIVRNNGSTATSEFRGWMSDLSAVEHFKRVKAYNTTLFASLIVNRTSRDGQVTYDEVMAKYNSDGT